MGWSLRIDPQSMTGGPKTTSAVPDKGAQSCSRRRPQSFASILAAEGGDDGTAAPRRAGAWEGSCAGRRVCVGAE